MVITNIIDMNLAELKYYPFVINLNECIGSCNVLSPKICVPKEAKNINIKAFNMIRKEEAKAITEHISYDCKCKFNSTTSNSNQKWNNKTCQCECKNYHKCKKDHSSTPSSRICENGKYLKNVANTSVTECNEITIVVYNVSTKKANTVATKKTNTIAANATSTALINCHTRLFYKQLYFWG